MDGAEFALTIKSTRKIFRSLPMYEAVIIHLKGMFPASKGDITLLYNDSQFLVILSLIQSSIGTFPVSMKNSTSEITFN